MNLSWMQWTTPTAIFLVLLITALTIMTIWDVRSPSQKYQGFLPLAFTRGERFFLSIVIFLAVMLLWMALLSNVSLWFALPVAAILIFVVVRYG